MRQIYIAAIFCLLFLKKVREKNSIFEAMCKRALDKCNNITKERSPDASVGASPPHPPLYFGKKKYELTDWLGNVRVVVNDRKTPVNAGNTTLSYLPQTVSVTDYYSFGSEIFERTYSHNVYRYGFNGKEDIEQRWLQDYGARYYNKVLGRFISADPLIVKQKQYAWLSSYQFAGNKPIVAIDLDGKEDVWINTMIFANGAKTEVITWKNEYNANTLKRNISENIGIPEWMIPNEGVFVSDVRYDENNKIANVLFHQVMPVNVEASRLTKGGGISGSIANYLEGIMSQKNYAGKEGMKNLGKDVLESAEKLGDAGFLTTVIGYGALAAGIPEVGIPLIEAGEALGTVGDVGEVGNAFVKGGMYEGIGEGVKKIAKSYIERGIINKIEKLPVNSLEKEKKKVEVRIGASIIEKSTNNE